MIAIQRFLFLIHWLVFLDTVFFWGAYFYIIATGNMTLGELKTLLFFEAPEIHLLLWLGLVSVGLIGWIFTGKFILWPWNRSLPKQED